MKPIEDIITGLKFCSTHDYNCPECPYHGCDTAFGNCSMVLKADAAEAIEEFLAVENVHVLKGDEVQVGPTYHTKNKNDISKEVGLHKSSYEVNKTRCEWICMAWFGLDLVTRRRWDWKKLWNEHDKI